MDRDISEEQTQVEQRKLMVIAGEMEGLHEAVGATEEINEILDKARLICKTIAATLFKMETRVSSQAAASALALAKLQEMIRRAEC